MNLLNKTNKQTSKKILTKNGLDSERLEDAKKLGLKQK